LSHISYSELKNWVQCPFYHNLVNIQKIKGFKGNEFTAFGTAIHTVCEKKLLHEAVSDDLFVQELQKNIADIDDDVEINKKLVNEMKEQGKRIIPEIDDAVSKYFGDYEVVSTEEALMVPIENTGYNFKGYIDAVIKTPDGKYHIIDWKSCSWGWDSRRRSDPIVNYQLTLYKHFFALKHDIDADKIETHFALLKRTAKNNNVEIFRATSGKKKTYNAYSLLMRAIHNITNGVRIKNKLSCTAGYGCEFYKTKHCP